MGLILFVGAAAVVAGIALFNRFIRLHRLAQNAWADIDVQLKRRHDLIPSLVTVVKGHAGYEKGTLEAVVEARGRAVRAEGPAAADRAEREVTGGVHRILAVAEAYPDLLAMQSFRDLQEALVEVEHSLQQARRYYNAVVRDFNTAIAQFPGSLIAGLMRYGSMEFFGLDDRAEAAVPVVDTGGGP